MPPFPKPEFDYNYQVAVQIAAWEERRDEFFNHMRYYISDHRILWAEFTTD